MQFVHSSIELYCVAQKKRLRYINNINGHIRWFSIRFILLPNLIAWSVYPPPKPTNS